MLRGSKIYPPFVNPHGTNHIGVTELAHQVIDMLIGHLSNAAQLPLQTDPGSLMMVRFPEHPQPAEILLPLIQQVLQGAMNPAHPGYMGIWIRCRVRRLFWGNLLSGALNNNMLSLEMAPFAARLEDRLMRLLAAEFGLSPSGRRRHGEWWQFGQPRSSGTRS
jgi:hypothetical protein